VLFDIGNRPDVGYGQGCRLLPARLNRWRLNLRSVLQMADECLVLGWVEVTRTAVKGEWYEALGFSVG